MSRQLLEQAIDLDPTDLSAWAVYGDWLQEQGDVRGEILSIEGEMIRRGEIRSLTARIEALVDQHYEEWVGPLLLRAMRCERGSDLVRLYLEHGFVTQARLGIEQQWTGPEASALLRELLEMPAARFLRTLTLGQFTENTSDYTRALELLAREQRSALRELSLGDPSSEDLQISWIEVGELAGVLGASPQLRSLKVHGGGIALEALRHERLEKLVFETGGLSAATARAVASGQVRSLLHLELWFGSPSYGGEAAASDLAGLWSAEGYPSLVHLGLRNAMFTDELVQLLTEAPLLARLRTLDLSKGTLSPLGAGILLDRSSLFQHLEGIVLDDNFLDAGAISALQRAYGKRVSASEQKQTYESDGYTYYVSVGE